MSDVLPKRNQNGNISAHPSAAAGVLVRFDHRYFSPRDVPRALGGQVPRLHGHIHHQHEGHGGGRCPMSHTFHLSPAPSAAEPDPRDPEGRRGAPLPSGTPRDRPCHPLPALHPHVWGPGSLKVPRCLYKKLKGRDRNPSHVTPKRHQIPESKHIDGILVSCSALSRSLGLRGMTHAIPAGKWSCGCCRSC